MKKLLFYIIFLTAVFKSFAAVGAESALPEDFKGLNTRMRMHELAEDDNPDGSFVQKLLIMYEIGNYFNNKYPNNEIFDEDFDEKLKPFFPHADEYQMRNYTNLLRNGVAVYRLGSYFYNKLVTEKLLPKSYKVVHSANDFDSSGEVKYIEAPAGKFKKVYNFKKFLTYSHNPDERKAIENFQELQDSKGGIYAQLNYAMSHIEWKKLFLYGEKYKNPLLSDYGVGQFAEGEHLEVRLLSDATTIDSQTEFYVGVQIITHDNSFILANNVSPNLLKPQIDLRGSENLAGYEVIYPAPQNTVAVPFAYKYFGNFLIPIKVKVKNPEEPLLLQAKIDLNSCTGELFCLPETFRLALMVLPGQDYAYANGYQNYFQQQLNILPEKEAQYFELTKFVADKDSSGESLRLEFLTHKKTEGFKIFIEDKDGYNTFSAPYISILDNKIFVRFEPTDKNAALVDSEYVITAVFNGNDAYRTTRLAARASLFDIQAQSLNLGLLFIAFIGGFILNFMPCVFPVLSLKIIALSRAGGQKKRKLKKSLLLTTTGIFSGFTLLILMLCGAKFAGYSLGWGMQYQNMTFLVAMAFLLAAFIALLPELQSKLPNFGSSSENKLDFVIGNLIVLLSTPCTGPYLATAVGFALVGGYGDIIGILYAVALGLSLPYILALCLKNPEAWLPSSGKWLGRLQKAMQTMLVLTILWFLTLVYNQTNIWCVLLLTAALLIFMGLFALYQKFRAYLNGVFDENVSLETLERLRKISTLLIIGFAAVCVSGISVYAEKTHLQNMIKYAQTHKTAIDKTLIAEKLAEGKPVLLEIGADWCLTCRYNGAVTLNDFNLQRWKEMYQLEFIRVDWTNYNKEVLDFMEKYGRKGLPFYILYTPLLRDGFVLPEMFKRDDFESMLLSAMTR